MKYYTVSETPLAYHNFMRFFVLPANILGLFGRIVAVFAGAALIDFYACLDVGLYLAEMALFTVCFVGCLKWKPYAWYTMMAIIVITPLDYFLQFLDTALTSPDDIPISLSKFLMSALITYLVAVYYKKRKPLFLRDIPAGSEYAESTEAARGDSGTSFAYSNAGAPAPQRPVRTKYCRRCGAPLPSEDSRFCRMCGAEVVLPAAPADTREQ